MKSHVQFITIPTVDTPGTALYLHFDDKRYLFGRVAEGLQRATIQSGLSMRKMTDVFVTGKSDWDSVGGLIGLILTLADVFKARLAAREENEKLAEEKAAKNGGVRKQKPATASEDEIALKVHGPPNLLHSVAAARRFVFRTGAPIWIDEIGAAVPEKDESGSIAPTWADHNIKVWAMRIKGTQERARKRSIDDVANDVNDRVWRPTPVRKASVSGYLHDERDDKIRQQVVHDMFRSDWRKDELFETALKDVLLPAKIWVRDPATKDLKLYDGPLPGGPVPLENPNLKVLTRKPWPGATVAQLPPGRQKHEALSYIVGTYHMRGKFSKEKATGTGVPPGPMWSALANGQSVQNEKGETITPDMVLGEGRIGHGFAIVDLPGVEYVNDLVGRPEWKDPEVMRGVAAIVWNLGSGISANSQLRDFMDNMSDLKHIVASPDHCTNAITMHSVAATSARLAAIDPDIFVMPLGNSKALPQQTFATSTNVVAKLPASAQAAESSIRMLIRPSFNIEQIEGGSERDTEISEEVQVLAEVARETNKQNKKAIDDWRSTIPIPDAEIVTLGTGSALPSKYRNVSSTLLRVPGHGSYLFDCGENTLGQLQRVFEPKELIEILRDLRMIWISHLHADHHLGTVSLIKAWYKIVHGDKASAPSASFSQLNNSANRIGGPGSPSHVPYLSVVSGAPMLQFLADQAEVEDFGYSHVFPLTLSAANKSSNWRDSSDNSILNYLDKQSLKAIPQHLYYAVLGLENIQAVLVKHCTGAMAVALTFPPSSDGQSFKAAYSGDCRPSADFAVIGQGASVLVHEATFDDELVGEAKAKMHSTTGEALKVAEAMGAKAVILTHFSQRYQKIPIMETVDGEARQREAVIAELEKATEGDEDVMQEDTEMGTEELVSEMQVDGPHDVAKPSDSIDSEKEVAVGVVSGDMKVCVAFDYMRVKVGDVARMEAMTPALVKLFEKEEEELKEDDNAKAAENLNPVEQAEGQKEQRESKKDKKKRRKDKGGKQQVMDVASG